MVLLFLTVRSVKLTVRHIIIVPKEQPQYLYTIKIKQSLKLKNMETYNLTSEEKFLQAQRRVKSIKGFYVHATVYFFVNTFIIGGCAMDDAKSLFTSEPYMTALFWGIGLLAHGMSVFGQDLIFGKNWEERKIEKLLRK